MVPTRRILAELVAMEPTDLEAELEDVRAEKVRLEMQEQLLAQALRMLQFARTDPARGQEGVEALAARAPALREQNLSENVLAIVRQAQGETLSPGDIQGLLADFNVQADASAIRQALRRWADRHQIIKNGHRYQARPGDVIKEQTRLAGTKE
jgi:hypothetical protein